MKNYIKSRQHIVTQIKEALCLRRLIFTTFHAFIYLSGTTDGRIMGWRWRRSTRIREQWDSRKTGTTGCKRVRLHCVYLCNQIFYAISWHHFPFQWYFINPLRRSILLMNISLWIMIFSRYLTNLLWPLFYVNYKNFSLIE